MAHTPGPWRAKGGTIVVNGSNCYEVREIWNDQGGFNPDDIRLMAAAPRLLALLVRGADALSSLEAACDEAGVDAQSARWWWQDVEQLLHEVGYDW